METTGTSQGSIVVPLTLVYGLSRDELPFCVFRNKIGGLNLLARALRVRRYTAVYSRSSRRCEISECRQPCDLFSVHSSHLFLQHPYERRRPPPRVVGLSALAWMRYLRIGLFSPSRFPPPFARGPRLSPSLPHDRK